MLLLERGDFSYMPVVHTLIIYSYMKLTDVLEKCSWQSYSRWIAASFREEIRVYENILVVPGFESVISSITDQYAICFATLALVVYY